MLTLAKLYIPKLTIYEGEPVLGLDGIFHYVYCVINNHTKQFYIGKRSTTSKRDSYYKGSGSAIKPALSELGRQNFTKFILGYFKTSEEAFDFEKSIVTSTLVKANACYNNKVGGQTWGKGENHPATKASIAGTHWGRGKKNPVFKQIKDGKNVFLTDNNPQKIASRNGTHHWLGENHPMKLRSKAGNHQWSGTNNPAARDKALGIHWSDKIKETPWEHGGSKKSPSSLLTWFHADEIFKLHFADNSIGRNTISKALQKKHNLPPSSFSMKSIQRILWKFEEQWVPSTDAKWLLFHDNFKPS